MQDNISNPTSASSDNAAVPTQTNNSAPTDGKKYKILVVEDEEDSKDVLVSLLNTAGKYEVSSAADGQDALAKLEAEQGKFEMVLLDIVMPKLDGIETLRLLKSDANKYGNPIVLMLTNLGGDVAVETAINLGAQGYLMKVETEPEQLLKRVEEELAKGVQSATTTAQNIVQFPAQEAKEQAQGSVDPASDTTQAPAQDDAMPKAA